MIHQPKNDKNIKDSNSRLFKIQRQEPKLILSKINPINSNSLISSIEEVVENDKFTCLDLDEFKTNNNISQNIISEEQSENDEDDHDTLESMQKFKFDQSIYIPQQALPKKEL